MTTTPLPEEVIAAQNKDFGFNWVISSRFLFHVVSFCLIAGFIVNCVVLYQHRYTGYPEVNVPESTLYTPKYK